MSALLGANAHADFNDFLHLVARVLIGSTVLKVFMVTLGFAVVSLPWVQRFRIYRAPLAPRQLLRELGPALVVVVLDVILIVGFRWFFMHRLVPATLASVVITYVWMFVSFEVWFYVTHRLMHLRPLYFLHAQHHVAHVTEPLTALSFSIPERLILICGAMGLLLLGTCFLPITTAGAALYMLTNYTLNIYGHSNIEWMPTWFLRSPLGRVLFTTTFHAMHHARYAGHYGLFTTVLDRSFGSAFPDYAAVHARARQGRGLTKLGERLHER